MIKNPTISYYKALLISIIVLGLSACGFHLKQATPLAFHSIYTNINLDREFGAQLERVIKANSPGTIFVRSLDEADIFLRVIDNEQTKNQISIDAEGRVDEYELILDFTFEILTQAGDVVLAPTTLQSIREIPYNERVVQAKESEIDTTFRDMRQSLIDLIMRRISAPEVQERYNELKLEYQNDDGFIESKAIQEPQ